MDFPFSRVHAVAWDPPAERYAVVYSSPLTSDAIDVLRYNGEQRMPAARPEAKLDANIETFGSDGYRYYYDGSYSGRYCDSYYARHGYRPGSYPYGYEACDEYDYRSRYCWNG